MIVREASLRSKCIGYIIEFKDLAIFEAGNGPTLTLRAFTNLTQRSYVIGGIALRSEDNTLSAGLNCMIARQLDRHTIGKALITIQLGIPNSFALASYTRKLEKNTKLKGSVKTGTFGSLVEYGCERQISEHSKLAATMCIGMPVGVLVKIKLTRASQVYNFPINLSEEIHPAAIFYGTVVPVAVFWVVKVLIVNPFLKMEKEMESEANKVKYAKQMAEKKRDAENSIRLMQETCERILEYETSRNGLVIVNAGMDTWYPWVKESSKSNLSGFYDPCPEEEKMLRIRYLFRDAVHEVTFGDQEHVRIPKQSHKIHSS
ncbi:DnaJ (Hsp40), sub C, member 11 [Desmophyllum pertusum]|uniref:DnaJ (Hsp40), sub C, member 11 n=1 Tax=Desmophyllum pertusum TaxID=174260 RepID=A0A9X0DB01_9CNID|nr:DnaJ (Hsp40), sub C, member 11 [Desmophyllum pertusum]